jgi:hypothetical protein
MIPVMVSMCLRSSRDMLTDCTKVGVNWDHSTPVDARPTEHSRHLLTWRCVEETEKDDNDDGSDL